MEGSQNGRRNTGGYPENYQADYVERKAQRNQGLGLNKEQGILLDFAKRGGECFKHRSKKIEIASQLRKEGKKVFIFIEKPLVLGGIKIRPDICYFEGERLI